MGENNAKTPNPFIYIMGLGVFKRMILAFASNFNGFRID